ncbi:MAG: N-acetylglucosamine-6-phosphate deacetylase [Acidimicrobiia bacterium]|nr:N-acetylglucosamine-6-phosphate deacetylase [Acidimicrobiia bacterium]
MTPRLADSELAALGVVEVVPGYVDLQINGVDDVDFSVARGDDWERAGRRLLGAGVTEYLATICSMPLDRYDRVLARVAAAQAATHGANLAEILGVHLEGPFLGGALGAHPASVVRPLELDWLMALLDAHPGLVRLVTLAPEADPTGAGIRALVERGIVVALGHSTCSYEDAVRAAEAGATLTTHLFNGMGPLHHREPGIAGAALDPRTALTPTLIADGVHVHPAVVAVVFAAASPILVSDAVATGVRYFDVDVTESGGAAYLANGTLTGAVRLLDDAVRNVVGFGVDRAVALAAASTRPAAVLGRHPGAWIGLDDELRVRAVWRGDQLIARGAG